MARSLPENTVDAWTAIELPRHAAPWIWLPTTNDGGTRTGRRPGDVSSVLARRLVVIESKGIENTATIPFGSDGRRQRDFLKAVEDAGSQTARTVARYYDYALPTLGWVFYGLPLDGTPDGSAWTRFPSWHYLMCPHEADRLDLGATSAVLTKVAHATHDSHAWGHRLDPAAVAAKQTRPLRLDWLGDAVRWRLAGLPPSPDRGMAGQQLADLVRQTRLAAREVPSLETDLIGVDEGGAEDNVVGLLHALASIVRSRVPHVTLAVV